MLLQGIHVNGYAKDKVTDIKECKHISNNLKRLTCYDNFYPPSHSELSKYSGKSKVWLRAMEIEKARVDGYSPIVKRQKNSFNLYITLPTINYELNKGGPILMLSCVDNISRLDLILNKPIRDGRINVSLAGMEQQMWRSDDTGLVISSSRGAVANDYIKSILAKDEVNFYSNNPNLNALVFLPTGLRKKIGEDYKQCAW
ncbi:type VI secretion system-associated protein TagO [Marinomonas sp. THO17]|uniref:type VI secretion system-associated protein TagO n=1 Tax=Marinomonas sp. THO17 TaxID=3149048 RepID=UPI00336C1B9E